MQYLDKTSAVSRITDLIADCVRPTPSNKVLLTNKDSIQLHEPFFAGNEWSYVKECIDTGWVSSVGSFVDRFEKDIASYTGASRAVAVVNGTSALHIALLLSGVRQDDEVIVSPLNFVAPANAITYCSAQPLFADIEEDTLAIDPTKLEVFLDKNTHSINGVLRNKNTGRRISALIAVHIFGHPCKLDSLAALCEKYGITMIEDAAEALGSTYHGKHVGLRGKLGVLSFNGNKTVTTGGGGALITNDSKLADQAKHLVTTARAPHEWEIIHDQKGYNYRLPNINAALGCAQMEQLPIFLSAKRRLAERYKAAFSSMTEVHFFDEPEQTRSNFWLNTLILDKSEHRNPIIQSCLSKKIILRPAWELLSKLPMFKESPRMDLSKAESIQPKILNLPSSVFLGL